MTSEELSNKFPINTFTGETQEQLIRFVLLQREAAVFEFVDYLATTFTKNEEEE